MGSKNKAIPLSGLDLPALLPGEAPAVLKFLRIRSRGRSICA
jgi:hypothetical protein